MIAPHASRRGKALLLKTEEFDKVTLPVMLVMLTRVYQKLTIWVLQKFGLLVFYYLF